ncbi:GNAT family N-acetyltransferase [Arenicella xantha]|uniref:N-acyltransferase n=1 Tax=Arenicella xantha TaxID=644221 RepID=A0A395JFF9_9GAMM|nr:GNAT family N-acetyltransferase [Arenicella xantha]RBP48479.1 hypothetical protein DFR28_10781 [Arenicella xantha]
MHIEVHSQISELAAQQWNAMLPSNNPFMRHEFLAGLEQTHCVCPETGWQPAHIAAYAAPDRAQLLGVMPCYVKSHSYGEYIFDWAWADAYQRHGLEYYPKLSNAVPFTPATGERILTATSADASQVELALIEHAMELVTQTNLSSFHSLFCTSQQAARFAASGLLSRHSTQFHWHNDHYATFDDFLAKMSSKKRKNIKRERRRVQEAGIQYRWLTGAELSVETAHKMYQFYARTINHYGAQSYLNREFFEYLAKHFSQQTLFLFAEHNDVIVAGGLYFRSDDTLYGRYWGANQQYHSVHFETCYYQAIDWCIEHGFQRFEAGAQGEHKLARGLEPVLTYSAHYLGDPSFQNAVSDFLQTEQQHIAHYQSVMASHSPFKVEL